MVHKSYSSGFGSIPNEPVAAPQDSDNDFLCAVQLQRIADSLEEVIRLVKEDQEKMKKLNDQKDFQPSDFYKSLALAHGQRLQEGSGKLQATSGKLDKKTLQ